MAPGPRFSSQVGQPVQVVGVVSQYRRSDTVGGGYRLLPRYGFDLVAAGAPVVAWPAVLPETGAR